MSLVKRVLSDTDNISSACEWNVLQQNMAYTLANFWSFKVILQSISLTKRVIGESKHLTSPMAATLLLTKSTSQLSDDMYDDAAVTAHQILKPTPTIPLVWQIFTRP